ncbi:MAG: amidophosphoribosyltransferase [Candidatus Lokiarchaeota archaeon]|nr:amidophosphoribosyltransferase [Candidatus Lokiarchaeota archaeon]MBD3341397.1 amidophosphoribosyltransferase [Candidatus Lokiarchaeota archaeon]
MGGLFGVYSNMDCVQDLFYGTDYHSHLGTMRGGLAVKNSGGFQRYIKNITNAQFRSKFEKDIKKMHGNKGIGVISDYDDQPLIINSHLGVFAIVTVGKINNIKILADKALKNGATFSEMHGGEINPTELVATIISQGSSFEDGVQKVHDSIDGSCTLLILTETGIYAARDKYGRTPLIIGEKDNSYAVTMETCAFPNLGYKKKKFLGPGEVYHINKRGLEQKVPPGEKIQICSFLWVYYGYPASEYENINVEKVRYRCGSRLARNDDLKVDLIAGIPDSGTAHGLGYAAEKNIPFSRPFVKYTPTWPRSFMPQDQDVREKVAKMKLIPIEEIIKGKRLLFCEDSIVRGTQLRKTIKRLYELGAKEVHMRPACPPLIYNCRFLNFSCSHSVLELAGRRAIKKLKGIDIKDPINFTDPKSENYKKMINAIREDLGLTSLKYQKLEDLIEAIGLPKEKLCTYCWDGSGLYFGLEVVEKERIAKKIITS